MLYKRNLSKEKNEKLEQIIVSKAQKIRETHKRMGARVMYYQLKVEDIGVNKFERILSKNGLSVKIKRRRIITTDGYYENCDTNLINGITLTNINQVIAGDITYLILNNKNYYIFSLKDMYSKRIVGLFASDTMLAINAVKTLKQTIKTRGVNIKNCIHHSDAGSQYKSNVYKNLLKKNYMKMSIAENCLQNGMAEQLNGVLKNDYIKNQIKDVKSLNKQLNNIKRLINEERPVKALGYKTPIEFERWIKNNNKSPVMELYDFTKDCEGTLKRHNNKKSLIV